MLIRPDLYLFAALLLPITSFGAGEEATTTALASPAPAVAAPAPGLTRYMVVRTFPAGALAGLDAAGEAAVNRTNAKYSVHWVHSYANAEKTKTFCIYEAPDEKAIRDAAVANKIPVDYVVPIPVVLGTQ
jgi:hypothetical protein